MKMEKSILQKYYLKLKEYEEQRNNRLYNDSRSRFTITAFGKYNLIKAQEAGQ